jgi:ribosomal protein S18
LIGITGRAMHYKETEYGFEYGSAKVTRMFSDEKKGWVTIGIETPKYKGHECLQVYITKTGKIRIFGKEGEWEPK